MVPPKLDCFAVAGLFGQQEVMLWLLQHSPVRASVRLADESPDVDLQQVMLKASAHGVGSGGGQRQVGSLGHRLAEELLQRNIFLYKDDELLDYLLTMPTLDLGSAESQGMAAVLDGDLLSGPAQPVHDPLEFSALRSLQLLRALGMDRRAADLLAERGGFGGGLRETSSSLQTASPVLSGAVDIRLAELVRWSRVELELRLGELTDAERAWFLPHWDKVMADVRSWSPLAQAAARVSPTSLPGLWDQFRLRLREAWWRGVRASKKLLGKNLWSLVAAALHVR